MTDDEVWSMSAGLGWKLVATELLGEPVQQWFSEDDRWGQRPAFLERQSALSWMREWLGHRGVAHDDRGMG
jgi:hypothetical protein